MKFNVLTCLLIFCFFTICISKLFPFIDHETPLESCFDDFRISDTNQNGFLEKEEFEHRVFSQLGDILTDEQMTHLTNEAFPGETTSISVSEKCHDQLKKKFI
jgi:Ca2+-binding EF-hand superfamily protein